MKKSFIVTRYYAPDTKTSQKVIFVDDELFDWGIEEEALEQARKFSKNDEGIQTAIHGDIQKYFLDSLSEFLGHTITLKEVNEAIENGFIECKNDTN